MPPLRVVGDEPTSEPERSGQFFLIVADHDRGFFSVEGPMTDDGPWKSAARHARDNLHRRIECGSAGPDRDALAGKFSACEEVCGRAAGKHREAAPMTDQPPRAIVDRTEKSSVPITRAPCQRSSPSWANSGYDDDGDTSRGR
jgi:hypothetical protein